MRKPSKQQLRLLGWLADPSAVLLFTQPCRGCDWRYSGWETYHEEVISLSGHKYTYWEEWDGRTCRSLIARGWVSEAPNTEGWAGVIKLYKINAAGRQAAERYLDLGDWVDLDEWGKAQEAA